MRRRRRRAVDLRQAAATTAAVVAAAAGVAALLRRRRASSPDGQEASAGSGRGPSAAPSASASTGSAGSAVADERWECECGQEFRVSGAGRHLVFWLADAKEDDPVLGDRCPQCDRSLAAAHESGTAAG